MKKTLSLVLVLCMVFSFFGFAGAAFTDEATIQYKEAVGVMTGIGAINGMGDGTFAPKGEITRAQAAKLVAYTILGKDVAKMLPVSASSFKDVDANFAWAIPSIEYLVQKNIINGRGDGTFDPNGKVTGYELAKMLLVANGFKGEYTGNSWALNVAIDASKAQIFKNSKATDYSKPATREEAALYCFNGIQYSATGSSTDSIYGITGWEKVEETLVPVYGWIEVPAVAKDSIMAAVYPTLKSVSTGTDDVGRPATVWTYTAKNTKIAAVMAEPVATFTKGITQHDLYKALGAAAPTINVVVNSESAQTTNTTVAAVKNSNTAIANSGNGVVSELYKTKDGLTLVQIVPDLAKVTGVTNHRATSTRGAYITYTLDNGLTGVVYTSVVDAESDVDTAVITGTVAKGDTVLSYKGAARTYINAVDTLTGKLTSITSTGIVTIDGKQTTKAEAFEGSDLTINTKENQSFYVDAYGYILGVKAAAAAESRSAMVVGLDSYSQLVDGKIVTKYMAVIAKPDGTTETVETTKANYGDGVALVGKVYAYTISSKGVYTFSSETSAEELTINNKNAQLKADLYANNATKFIIANFTKNEAGQTVPTGTATVYTGINNVPNYGTVNAVAMDLTSPADKIADVVYIYNPALQVVAADSYVFVLGTYTRTGDGYVFDTIVKGQPSTITLKDLTSGNNALIASGGLFSSVSITAGEATAIKATTTVDKLGNVGNLLFTSTDGGSNYAYASKAIADDVPVYTYYLSRTEAPSVVIGSGADLVTPVEGGTDNIFVVYNAANTAVAAVYVIVPAA